MLSFMFLITIKRQKDDLKNQIAFIRQYANAKGVILDETIQFLASRVHPFYCRHQN